MSDYRKCKEDAARVAEERAQHYESLIARGKGEWPFPGYVSDETWAGWHRAVGESRTIAQAILALPEPPEECECPVEGHNPGCFNDPLGKLLSEPQTEPVAWSDLAMRAANVLRIVTGHDSGANLRHRYGEKWWEPIEALEKELRASISAAPPSREWTDEEILEVWAKTRADDRLSEISVIKNFARSLLGGGK